MSRPGHEIPPRPDLGEAHEILVFLEQQLGRERTAIGALDLPALAATGARKQELLDRLYQLRRAGAEDTPANGEDVATRRLRGKVRDLSTRVRALAEANSALLSDAIVVIGDRLGLRTEAGTYDSRARLRYDARSVAGRRV